MGACGARTPRAIRPAARSPVHRRRHVPCWLLPGQIKELRMKRSLFGLIGSLALASTLVAAQGTAQQPPTETQKPVDVVLTGCIIQGSAPTIFILDNAKV